MHVNRLRALALVALCVCPVAFASAQSRNGFAGRPAAEVLQNDVFTAYKLSVVRRRPSREGRPQVSQYQPAGPLGGKVQVIVRSTDEGVVATVDATIERSLLDGAGDKTAREFLRAFVRDGMRRGEQPAIDTLVKELEGTAANGSPAYEVVLGRRQEFTIAGKQSIASFANLGAGNARLLRISFRAAGFVD